MYSSGIFFGLSLLVILLIIMLVVIVKMNQIEEELRKIKSELAKCVVKTPAPALSEPEEDEKVYEIPQETIVAESTISAAIDNTKFEIPETPEKKGKSGFESMFLGNVFNKIGAIALLLAAGWFFKVVSPYINLSDGVKIALWYIIGLVMIAGAKYLNKEKTKIYAQVLCGTGIGVLFITTNFAAGLFQLFPAWVASIITLIITGLAAYISIKHKALSTLAIGLIGGYFSVGMVYSAYQTGGLFTYLILLNMLSAIYVFVNKKNKPLDYINLLITLLIMTILPKEGVLGINLIYVFALWGVYFAKDLLHIRHMPEFLESGINRYFYYINYGILILFLSKIYTEGQAPEFSMVTLFSSVIYLIAGMKLSKTSQKAYIASVYLFLAGVAGAIYIGLDGTARITLWCLQVLIMALYAYKFKAEHLYMPIVNLFYLLMINLFFIKNALSVESISDYKPILNIRTVLYGVPVLTAFISSKLLQKIGSQCEKSAQLLRIAAITLIYLFASTEINITITKYCKFDAMGVDLMKTMSNITIGFIYAVQMMKNYFITKYRGFSFLAHLLYFASLIVLLFTGTENSNSFIPLFNMRAIAFIACMSASFLFARWNKLSFFNYAGLIMGLLLVNTETLAYTSRLGVGSVQYIATSVMWLIYAGIITLAGILRNLRPMKMCGIWITLIAILKILLWDMLHYEALYRFIAFISLGIILMVVSYFYSRHQNKES